jgi:hypothetical protein
MSVRNSFTRHQDWRILPQADPETPPKYAKNRTPTEAKRRSGTTGFWRSPSIGLFRCRDALSDWLPRVGLSRQPVLLVVLRPKRNVGENRLAWDQTQPREMAGALLPQRQIFGSIRLPTWAMESTERISSWTPTPNLRFKKDADRRRHLQLVMLLPKPRKPVIK